MIDKPITIRPEDLWTEEEIEKHLLKEMHNPEWIPQQHWIVIDSRGNRIPHPKRQ